MSRRGSFVKLEKNIGAISKGEARKVIEKTEGQCNRGGAKRHPSEDVKKKDLKKNNLQA